MLTGSLLATVNTNGFGIGHGWGSGGTIYIYNSNTSESYRKGSIYIQPYLVTTPSNISKTMVLKPDGTWTWDGQPVQTSSDQRLKQQISEIDDKLLDAWKDVTLCQFKYNDAVDQKKDKARLHTGYVVQQINESCQKHNIDISKYGLYCHEEYPQEVEEVTIENEDGTIKKETKVIREASEHYSLRYTEIYAIECAYLRRENNKLKQQMLQYTESLSKLEERLKALEQPSK